MEYRAFVSYSHKDSEIVAWFHRRLEKWPIPRDLIGRVTENGKVPESLRPVFRDRDDFAGGYSLEKATMDALQASEFLLVFCSPHSAASAYVNEEVRIFKALGRSSKVIPIIIDGDPGDPELECFPPAIRFQVDGGGNILEDPANPIAPDARERGDGRMRALAKVVAGILGVPFDEIIRREARLRRNRAGLLVGCATGAVLFATGFSSYSLYRSHEANVAIDRSIFAIGGLIQEGDRLDGDNVEQSRRRMLRSLCDLIDGLDRGANRTGLIERTVCLCEQAAVIDEVGEGEQALDGLRNWIEKLEVEVATAKQPSFEQATSLAKAAREVARIQLSSSEGAGGGEALVALLERTEELGSRLPDHEYLREVHDEALWALVSEYEEAGEFTKSLAIMERAAALRELQTDASDSLQASVDRGTLLRRCAWICGTHLDQPRAALEYSQQAVSVLSHLPDRRDLMLQKILALETLGDAFLADGQQSSAADRYRSALAIAAGALSALDEDDPLAATITDRVDYLEAQLAQLAQ